MCCRVTKILRPKHFRIPTILTYKYHCNIFNETVKISWKRAKWKGTKYIYMYIKREESRSTRLYSWVTLLFNLLAPCHRSSLSLSLSRIFARI